MDLHDVPQRLPWSQMSILTGVIVSSSVAAHHNRVRNSTAASSAAFVFTRGAKPSQELIASRAKYFQPQSE